MARITPLAREWRVRPAVPPGSLATSGLPPIVAQVLHNRGFTTRSEIDSFLNPPFHDPFLLPGMEAATRRLSQAVMAGETVAIFGDFDVDGVTGTAVVAEGLGGLGTKVLPYIPDRMTEGHGLSQATVRVLRDQGASVLVTVDTGVTSVAEVALAQDLGMDVIVTDHHIPHSVLPPGIAIIDPKLEVSAYPFPHLSGAGLAFKLVQGLYDHLAQPWSRSLLELAALSTVADLVPLKDENRFLVKEGLKELRHTARPGLAALYELARIRPESMDVERIAFAIAPRLNAAGRLDHASTSYRLLLTRSPEESETLACRLEELNRERQRLTEEATSRALETVSALPSIPAILITGDDQLSPGIAGLVASRLAQEYRRPAVVMSWVDGVIRASARSIPDFDINAALSSCSDLFNRHGGHPQAAGFEMSPENLPSLKQRLGAFAEEGLEGLQLKPSLEIDAEISLASLPGETYRWLKDLEPFGVENPRPVFLTRGFRPVNVRTVGRLGQHLRLKLKEGNVVWTAMAFGKADQWVPGAPSVDLVYNISTDWYGGVETMTLRVLDFIQSAP